MQDVYNYLFLTTKIRSMEPSLLNQERMERMLEAKTNADAMSILAECGYGEFSEPTVDAIDEALAAARQRMMTEIGIFVPDPEMVDIFKIRYDYHNVKVLLKAEAMNTDPAPLLMDIGRVPVKMLETKVRANDLASMPYLLRSSIADARETLGTTQDPQLADFVLDRAYYEEMCQLADKADAPFLSEYVRMTIDATNLRTVVRTVRMGKHTDFLRDIIFPGGNIRVERVLSAASAGGSIAELFAFTPLKAAAEAGVEAMSGGPLTRFEKLCDDAVMSFLKTAKYATVGDAPVVAYLAAKENEFTAIRIILTGRFSGIDAEIIKERLREAYV